MRNLSPEQIYWFTLLGIAGCFFMMGYALGMLRGGRLGYQDGWHDHDEAEAPAVKRLHFTDLKTPPTWVTDDPSDSSLVPDASPLSTGGAQ